MFVLAEYNGVRVYEYRLDAATTGTATSRISHVPPSEDRREIPQAGRG